MRCAKNKQQILEERLRQNPKRCLDDWNIWINVTLITNLTGCKLWQLLWFLRLGKTFFELSLSLFDANLLCLQPFNLQRKPDPTNTFSMHDRLAGFTSSESFPCSVVAVSRAFLQKTTSVHYNEYIHKPRKQRSFSCSIHRIEIFLFFDLLFVFDFCLQMFDLCCSSNMLWLHLRNFCFLQTDTNTVRNTNTMDMWLPYVQQGEPPARTAPWLFAFRPNEFWLLWNWPQAPFARFRFVPQSAGDVELPFLCHPFLVPCGTVQTAAGSTSPWPRNSVTDHKTHLNLVDISKKNLAESRR